MTLHNRVKDQLWAQLQEPATDSAAQLKYPLRNQPAPALRDRASEWAV
jgi:hypothetical protein